MHVGRGIVEGITHGKDFSLRTLAMATALILNDEAAFTRDHARRCQPTVPSSRAVARRREGKSSDSERRERHYRPISRIPKKSIHTSNTSWFVALLALSPHRRHVDGLRNVLFS